jgi:hypothetical protein
VSNGDQESHVRNIERAKQLDQRQIRIRELNDRLRTNMEGGRWVITGGINGLGRDTLAAILEKIRSFNMFMRGNDPHDEHDFGAIELGEERIFWKIDYYDKQLEYGSPDPANPDVTARVITIMLAGEY